MQHFDQLANEWDSPEKIRLMKTLSRNVREKVNFGNKSKILDIGCGTGLFGMEFCDEATEIVGVDTSNEMLNVFKNKETSSLKIRTYNINVEIEKLDEKFDLIVSSMAFHHMEKPQIVIDRIFEMLNDNGVALIVDLDKEDGSFHPDNDAMGVKHFGFTKEELLSWSQKFSKVNHCIINEMEKNDKQYAMFLLELNK